MAILPVDLPQGLLGFEDLADAVAAVPDKLAKARLQLYGQAALVRPHHDV